MSRIKIFNEIVAFTGGQNGRGYEVKAKSAKEAEVWIYEEIGDSWYGGISASQFAKDIKALGAVEKITLRVNSPGGDVFDGIAIYNILKQHKASVDVYIDGLAASIASVIVMAGDSINMASNAMMMIHNAWTVTVGDAKTLRESADILEKIDSQLVKTYMARAKSDEKQIVDMMIAETWLTAEDALEHGLIDRITDSLDMAAKFDLKKFKYRNIPQKSRAEPVAGPASIRQRLASMKMASLKMAAKQRSTK